MGDVAVQTHEAFLPMYLWWASVCVRGGGVIEWNGKVLHSYLFMNHVHQLVGGLTVWPIKQDELKP